MSLQLKTLELEGFRSFKQRCLISFPESGALLINGLHVDGSTGSGSGKSSILKAIAFALGFNSLPATKLKNWDSKKLFVKLTLKQGDTVYVISREPKLRLWVNGTEIESTVDANKKLTEILGLPFDLVKTLTYRPQRTIGKFINSTDSEAKNFLTEVLRLSDIEKAQSQFLLEISTLESNISIKKNNIETMKNTLLSIKVSDIQIEEAEKMLKSAQIQLKELQLPKNDQEKQNNEENLKKISLEVDKINTINKEVNTLKLNNQTIRNQIEQINQEIKVLKDNCCPTCKREWNDTAEFLEKKEIEVNSLISKMKENLVYVENAKPFLSSEYQNKVKQQHMKLYSWSQGVSNSHSNALMAKNAAKSNLSNLISVRNQQKELKNKIDSSLVELDEASEQLVIIKHSASLLSRTGFLGVIFSEVLKSIEISANELISFMPNINMLTLKLSSSTTTKTGKVNQKIEKSVMMDGKQVSIDSLSGGQRASLELCTDLAVSEAIRGRFGVDLGWVALDEAFDGLDVNTKMAALEIIKSKVNGLLIVVDHSSEIKEVFDKVVEVTFDGRQSKVSI